MISLILVHYPNCVHMNLVNFFESYPEFTFNSKKCIFSCKPFLLVYLITVCITIVSSEDCTIWYTQLVVFFKVKNTLNRVKKATFSRFAR